ncbi:SAM-dependent methyltransferase [uncultured Desulfosarcina sp.]|uniref:SAM-dependent methyltransferase n=1 Tax=uncultured Desulfosarcina sp. TaxID=218289 RepID=UPI0029C7F2FA|nr:SAM-dependent methyltransferase [uncultured Desulfosarcina sp.]
MQGGKIKNRIWIGGLLVVLVWMFAVGCSGHTLSAGSSRVKTPGSYTVVGIGPGDGDLLTVRAVEAIRHADVVFCSPKNRQKLAPYVDFTGKQVLDGYGVLFRFYGKDCKQLSTEEKPGWSMGCEEYHRKQAEFAALVREAVSAGKHVVMLSSGDPTIYGPDIWSLKELHDLDPVIVPGLSAFNAANAALQVSLGEVILTAPFKKEGAQDTIEQLAVHERATMVIFMPRKMQELFARLEQAYPAQTPAAIVTNAGVVGQETVTLGTVGGFAADLSGVDQRRSIVYVGRTLERAQFRRPAPSTSAGSGKFYLVGVGPGDPDLITLRGLKVIESADLIFAHQRLKDKFQDILAGKNVLTGYHRLFPFHGKKCTDVTETESSRERMSCEEYHQKQAEFAALVRTAVAEGKTVAVLDSGDPLVYGPCSWSLTELSDLDTEVVPGLSCFNAANAALKAGVTEGRASHSVILASGWSVEEMAVHQSTMVLFTMRTEFKKFIDSLSNHYPSDTPVAIVFSAGYADRERVMHGTLGTILEQMGTGRPPFEYLLYVGDFLADGGRFAQ